MKYPSIDVVIPSYKPGASFRTLLSRLSDQTYPVRNILIINTDERKFDSSVVRGIPRAEVFHISKAEFDHAGTRNMGAWSSGFCRRSGIRKSKSHMPDRFRTGTAVSSRVIPAVLIILQGRRLSHLMIWGNSASRLFSVQMYAHATTEFSSEKWADFLLRVFLMRT